MTGQDESSIAGREAEGGPGPAASAAAGFAPASGNPTLLLGATLACTLASVPLLAAPLVPDRLPVLATACLAGALLLTAAGFGATLLLVQARAGARLPAWPQPLLAIGAGVLAATVVLAAWGAPDTQSPATLLAVGGAMLVLAFPVLVLERSCAIMPEAALAEAAGLAALLRVVLLVQLWLGLALVAQGGGFPVARPLLRAPAVLVLIVALEFGLRGSAALFVPPPAPSARPAARSLVAEAIRLRPRPIASANQAVRRQLGIDLSRSWALGFVGRALAPVGLLLALLAWGLTGLVALPLEQRAVYERLGRPVEVLQPGLHLRLPWPLGVTRRVERGVLHELALAGPAPLGVGSGTARPAAEDPPPQNADRLWDRPHPGEATYLIASPAASGQGFQRVDVDLRLITRIGLSDAAARQAAYGVADPDALVRATAGRLLARYFATRTLAGVLGEDRRTFTDTIRSQLQEELDRLRTGVEIVAVVVEGIHPPPAAADAWHNVEAAEIRARVAIADETGAAAKTAAEARSSAELAADEATARAAEAVAQATADHTLFGADRAANAAAPDAFQLERWLARLRTALSRAQLLVIDHRLAGLEPPTLDLRDLAPPAATPP